MRNYLSLANCAANVSFPYARFSESSRSFRRELRSECERKLCVFARYLRPDRDSSRFPGKVTNSDREIRENPKEEQRDGKGDGGEEEQIREDPPVANLTTRYSSTRDHPRCKVRVMRGASRRTSARNSIRKSTQTRFPDTLPTETYYQVRTRDLYSNWNIKEISRGEKADNCQCLVIFRVVAISLRKFDWHSIIHERSRYYSTFHVPFLRP